MIDTKQTVMDIAMNLNRIGNWIADDFDGNRKKIDIFIKNTDEYISKIKNINNEFNDTWIFFRGVYPGMKLSPKVNAENFMTWGNILTHRSKLIYQ